MLDREVFRNQLISRRTFILAGCKGGIFSALLARMFYLQIIKGDEYQVLSDKNRISLVMIAPERGIINDRYGIRIAENRPSFFLKLDRKQTKSYKKSLEILFEILALNEDSQRKIYEKLKKTSYRAPLNILEDITWEQVALIEERIYDLPGVYVESSTLRKYNYGETCAHITGYVGKMSQEDQNEFKHSSAEFQVGKSGIEKKYEEILQGKLGYRKIEVDAHGLYINQIEKVDSVIGETLNLTINFELQDYIHKIMDPVGSSAVVMDVKNGDILALCSMPAFDPTEFIGGISAFSWKKLINDPYKPLINKVIQTQYPPGSTFKLITTLAALEAGVDPSYTVFCSGHTSLGNKIFNCWYHSGHGNLDMIGAIKHSCNCYMYNIGKLIGAEKILSVAKRFQYGKATSIDLPDEARGFVPDRQWKIRNFKFDWSVGDSFNISIGQGALLSTPIQQARVIAAFANGGKLLKPRITDRVESEIIDLNLNPKHLEVIKEGMFKVINEDGGSARGSKALNVILAGKTGTSQVQAKKNAKDDLSRSSIKWERRNHALFAGFAPFDDPKYAISIIVDHGGAGARVAAPIAKKICEFLF